MYNTALKEECLRAKIGKFVVEHGPKKASKNFGIPVSIRYTAFSLKVKKAFARWSSLPRSSGNQLIVYFRERRDRPLKMELRVHL